MLPPAQVFAQPEFDGLWDRGEPEAAAAGGKLKTNLSKLEQKMMEEARLRQKENIIKKQVVWGKEFSATPFISKPAVLWFRDFDVGKTCSPRPPSPPVCRTSHAGPPARSCSLRAFASAPSL